MATSIVNRVAARDEALLERMLLSPDASDAKRVAWTVVTHAGGSAVSILASLAPLWFEGSLGDGARRATILLVLSHLVVQLVKRTVSRPRPRFRHAQLIRVPDQYSFPSGHAAAAVSVAIGYASVFPVLVVPLLLAAGLVGASRIVLGVHFPADVLAGQLLTVVTASALAPVL